MGQQHPDYFWIGCSDSRVPATEIMDLDPGEMFVHRNVGNLVPSADTNFNAALQFAVDVLGVHHVMVVGHYGCGGIRAARQAVTNDAVGLWLAPIRALCWKHRHIFADIPDESAQEDRLCELNVIAQVEQLSANPTIVAAWRNGQALSIHGLVYAIGDGLIGTVCDSISAPAPNQSDWSWNEQDSDANIL
ncbi:MAG: carbonic anhydrase [Sphingomonadaceae bacterium]